MNHSVSILESTWLSVSRLRWLFAAAILCWVSAARAQTNVATQPTMKTLRLANLPAEKMESVLRGLLGDRLRPLENTTDNRPGWLFTHASGRQAELLFDRRQNDVTLRGPPPLVDQLTRFILAVDSDPAPSDRMTRVIRLRRANPKKVMYVIEAYRSGQRDGRAPPEDRSVPRSGDTSRLDDPLWDFSRTGMSSVAGRTRLVAYLAQGADGGGEPSTAPATPPDAVQPIPTEQSPEGSAPKPPARRNLRSLDSDLDVETLPDLDAIILRGRHRDVEELRRIIEEIERLSVETQPQIEIVYLNHAGCEWLATIFKQVDPDLTRGRQGRVVVIALVKPNALLLIGWGEALKSIKDLAQKLDQPIAPETQFRVFRLRHAAATATQTTIQSCFSKQTGLGPQVTITADVHTNSLVVQAAPRDLDEVELLVQRLDQPQGDAMRQARVFKLNNALAVDIAGVLNAAIGATKTGTPGQKNATLELLSIDTNGQKLLRAGILDDVQITPDPHTNSLVVAGPVESMELLEALVKQLDVPASVAQIKVFRIINGDATSLVQMLHTLMSSRSGGAAGAPLTVAEGETSLVPVRFSVDLRTNSIIATCSQGDLAIIEAL